MMAGDFIFLSGFNAQDQVVMARTIIFVFQIIQRDLTLRGIEVAKELQTIFLENFDKIDPDRLFDNEKLPDDQNIARQGKTN